MKLMIEIELSNAWEKKIKESPIMYKNIKKIVENAINMALYERAKVIKSKLIS
jgi:hypothetical protein